MFTANVRSALVLGISSVFLFGPCRSLAGAPDDTMIIWERIEGITPVAGFVGQSIEGIGPVGFPWTVEHGQVRINLHNRRFHFFIQGLAIGAMPGPISPIGTTGVVTWVRGTFVCTGGGPIIDTDAVELSFTGDAFLKGRVSDALDFCDPDNLVFLLRVAAVLPGAPNITGSWLAYGASRRLGNR